MSRGDFVLVTHPERQPAVDFITRSGEGPFVDTGVDIRMRPHPGAQEVTERLYLSKATIAQMAEIAGVSKDSGVSEGREQQLIAQGKLEGLREALDERMVGVADTLQRWLDAGGVGGGPVLGSEDD